MSHKPRIAPRSDDSPEVAPEGTQPLPGPHSGSQPPEDWAEHVEWECLMPANPFAPERWIKIDAEWAAANRPDYPSRTRRVWVGPWQEAQ